MLAKQAAGHQEGKGGKGGGQGHQWPQPQHSFRQLPPGSPPQVSAAVRAEEEREARRQRTARYEALARMEHQRRRRQAPKPGPETIYRLEMGSGRGRSERQGEQEGTGGGHNSQPNGGPQGGEGQAGRSGDAATGHHGQREGGQESGRQRSGQARARGTGRGEESGKDRHSEPGARGIGEGRGGLQGRGPGKERQQGAGGKGQGKAGQAGKGQGKVGGGGYMGSPAFPGKGMGGWWGSVVLPTIPPFPPPPYPAVGTMYPPPPAYPGVLPPTPVRQHPQGGRAMWGAQGGKGEEHRRAWERIGEEERRLRDREARTKGEAARVAEGRAAGQGTPGGGEAQAIEELHRAWADLRRRLERVERAEREGERPREHAQESGGSEGRLPLQPFRQPDIPPEVEREMHERAWRKIRDEAARLAERDREVAERERRVREEEEAVARGAHRVIPDVEGDTPLHGCGGTVAVQEEGKRGGRRGWASAGKGAPGGGAGSRGSSGGTTAH